MKVKCHGLLGANVYTVVDGSRKDEEYEQFDAELYNEIIALLQARGYIVKDIYLQFSERFECNEYDIINFEKLKKQGERKAQEVYSKANAERFRID
jgi:L-rhamnose mutarotase